MVRSLRAVPFLPVVIALSAAAAATPLPGYVAEPGSADPANLAALRAALDLSEALATAPGGSAAERAVAAAGLVTAWQATALGMPMPAEVPFPEHATPGEAVRALAARHALPVAGHEAELAALDGLPAEQAEALTRLVDAFLGFEDSARLAFADADVAALRQAAEAGGTPPPLRAFGVDFGPLFAARGRLLDAGLGLQAAWPTLPGSPPASASASAAPDVDLCPAIAIDTIGSATTYSEDCALVIDVAGSDVHANNAGGSGMVRLWGCQGAPAPTPGQAAALFDLAGDDAYGDGTGCGKNGGGAYGAGLLVDLGGNDLYASGSWGTNGGGNVGAGLLVDAGGRDTYVATEEVIGSSGTNGGGNLGGAGLLVDLDGDDEYAGGGSGSLGGGASAGVGALADLGGNDRYTATSCHQFDLITDRCTLWGDALFAVAGGGAAGGIGFLYDHAGDDEHLSGGHYGANGGAYLGSVGFLLDGGGNDLYAAASLGTNGGGYFGGAGLLLDRSGDDVYTAGDEGTNGGGNMEGVGALVDLEGNDRYTAGSLGANGGGFGGVGLLADLGGSDTYADQQGGTGTDLTVLPKGVAGAQLDCPVGVLGPSTPDRLATVCSAVVPNPATDLDGDGVPDDHEPFLCDNENPNLLSEGHCVGDDYVPPNVDDVVSDLVWLLTGERP